MQAFCGPVAIFAMGFVAVAGFVRAAAPHILTLFGIRPLASLVALQEAVPTRINDFTTASLLLSIGIPLLKLQHRPLYVQHSLASLILFSLFSSMWILLCNTLMTDVLYCIPAYWVCKLTLVNQNWVYQAFTCEGKIVMLQNLTSLFCELCPSARVYGSIWLLISYMLSTSWKLPGEFTHNFLQMMWSLFAQDTLRCVGAAIPVALGYAQTTSQVKKLPKGGFQKGEALWRRRHRWAARRLCGLMTEFRE